MARQSITVGALCIALTLQISRGFVLAEDRQCYQCAAAVSPLECSEIGKCSGDQECYTERYLSPDETEAYRLGCISKEVCKSPIQSTNDSHCFSCCAGNTCNRNICMKDTCQPSYYGPFCTNTCGYCADGEECHTTTGHCANGCFRGYQPPLCDTKLETCPKSFYGPFCTDVCGHCLHGEQCEKTNGTCPNGCDAGFLPPYCHATQGLRCHQCEVAFSPHSCLETAQCLAGQKCYTERYLVAGTTQAYRLGCVSEHICGIASKPNNDSHCFSCCTGDKCNRDMCMKVACPRPYYGPFCTDLCGHCANGEQCDMITGQCENGCAAGYLPPFCHPLSCPEPYYGPYCTDICGHCADGEQCEKTTGLCTNGCKDGYLPPYCHSTCPEPWYGAECSYICGHCAHGAMCERKSGLCRIGCESGFYPPFCSEDLHPVVRDCSDIKEKTNASTSGIFQVANGNDVVNVWCDMETDDKGWTVFQRRIHNNILTFSRNWTEYKNGFGNPSETFWWGNDKLADFTARGQHVLRIDMVDSLLRRTFIEYQNFCVENEQGKYRLHLGTATGIASNYFASHNEARFSTIDQDNDSSSRNCAAAYGPSGWWFVNCFHVNLNGQYHTPGSHYTNGIVWSSSNDATTGSVPTLMTAEMKFRSM